MSLFTPVSGTIGGSLIGLSAGVLLLGNGDILGCSGIVSSIFVKPKETFGKSNGKWKVLFVTAFLLTSRLVLKLGQTREELEVERQIVAQSSSLPIVSNLGFAVAGFLVGFGTRLGNGCTTGHGICGMARLSKRSLAAVATFMSAGLFSASMCSPMCMWAKFLRTTAADGVRAYFPTERSVFYSAILLAVSCGMTIPLLMPSKSKSGDDASKKGNCDSNSKAPMAVLSAMIFSTGLNISGMTKNYKIYNFLDLKLLQKGGWDPTLICVMGSGLLVSAISYHFVKGHNIFKNDKALACPLLQDKDSGKFNVPTNTNLDLQLILGSGLFGVGWGIAGLCPGPALFLAANGYPGILFYWWPCNIAGAILGEKAKLFI